MVQKFLFTFCVVFLAACRSTTQSAPIPAKEIMLSPSATATRLAMSTSTATPPTATSKPTVDPNLFRDDFIEALDADWSWIREDPLNWSLVILPGSLQINVGGGYVPAHSNSNLLLRPAPAGNFQIETQITFRPEDNFQFAGLIVYENDSNFIQGGRAYCSAVGCVGDGLYMDYYKKGVAVTPNFGHAYTDFDTVSLRLSRWGDSYTLEASRDGKVWFRLGSHISDINPLQIGLVAGQKLEGRILPAAFEYFEVRSLP